MKVRADSYDIRVCESRKPELLRLPIMEELDLMYPALIHWLFHT